MQVAKSTKRKGVRLFTSECVTVGHPDKTSDYISDAVLTEILKHDVNARVAVETVCHPTGILLAGEVTTTYDVPYEEIVRRSLREIGYIHPDSTNADTVPITVDIHAQSPDIALGTNDNVGGAGDQGMVLGGAVSETSDYMPLPITIARALVVRLTEYINEHIEEPDPMLRPDAKTQVTVAYGRDNQPKFIDTVVVSVSHSHNADLSVLRELVRSEIIKPVLKDYGFDINDVSYIYINPTGSFAKYGPDADTGLTGRKLVVDTYGSYFGHGGGAFSGKDPTKTDRSGAYMARYIAKNVVASGVADKCEIQIAYAIGVAKPVSVNVNMFGTNKYPVGIILKAIRTIFDMTPAGITKELQLRSGDIDYRQASVFGHFGEFAKVKWPWESTKYAKDIEEYCKNNYVDRGR